MGWTQKSSAAAAASPTGTRRRRNSHSISSPLTQCSSVFVRWKASDVPPPARQSIQKEA